jgi:uncharacterized protein with HEPN domain
MSKRTAKLLLEDILASSEKIHSYTKDFSFEQFIADDKKIQGSTSPG